MIIRPATHSDVERMDEICEAAKAAMRNMGIDQWQDGYPNRACWEADVDDGFAYVAETDEGTVAGMFALVTVDGLTSRRLAIAEALRPASIPSSMTHLSS